jgi:hypothetical protein
MSPFWQGKLPQLQVLDTPSDRTCLQQYGCEPQDPLAVPVESKLHSQSEGELLHDQFWHWHVVRGPSG